LADTHDCHPYRNQEITDSQRTGSSLVPALNGKSDANWSRRQRGESTPEPLEAGRAQGTREPRFAAKHGVAAISVVPA
jgi:hypothetical protein